MSKEANNIEWSDPSLEDKKIINEWKRKKAEVAEAKYTAQLPSEVNLESSERPDWLKNFYAREDAAKLAEESQVFEKAILRNATFGEFIFADGKAQVIASVMKRLGLG